MDGCVIVGHDGSERGDDALALGTLIAKALDARVLVAAVVEYPRYAEPSAATARAARQRMAPLFERASDEAAPLEVRSRVLVEDSPGQALHSLAEAEHAAVISVGSAHRGPVGRLLLGSVGEALLSGAQCAIAVAPSGYAERPDRALAQLGVCVNGSPESHAALASAAALAKRAGASLTVIAVVPPVPPDVAGALLVPLGREELGRSREEQVEGLLDRASEELGADLEVRRRLLKGDPAERLTEAAEKLDLLVVGSRRYGPVRSALMGGVSRKLMRTARTPVLVVPRGVSELSARPSSP